LPDVVSGFININSPVDKSLLSNMILLVRIVLEKIYCQNIVMLKKWVTSEQINGVMKMRVIWRYRERIAL
jgi:hypothetical protein